MVMSAGNASSVQNEIILGRSSLSFNLVKRYVLIATVTLQYISSLEAGDALHDTGLPNVVADGADVLPKGLSGKPLPGECAERSGEDAALCHIISVLCVSSAGISCRS